MGKSESKAKTRVRIALVALAYVLLLAPIVIFAVARTSAPTKEQAAALKLMEMPPPPAGRNAFAALWLIGYPMPEAELEDAVAQDVKRYKPWSSEVEFDSVAARHYEQAQLNDEATRKLLCARFDERDCVARILADPAPHRALVARHQDLIERYRRLDQYTYLRSPFPPDLMVTQTPRVIDLVALVRTQDVLALADGDPARALTGLCRSMSTSRRLLPGTASMLDTMLQVLSVKTLARDTGDVLARLPRDTPLPAECRNAVAEPTLAELSFCNAARGEFAYQRYAMEHWAAEGEYDDDLPAWYAALTFDLDSEIAQRALDFAGPCSAPTLEAVAADIRAPSAKPDRRNPMQCIDNARGCAIWSNGNVDLGPYQHRQQDHAAHVRMLGAALMIRSQAADGRTLQQRLDALPPALRSQHRPYQVVPGGVRIEEYQRGDEGETQWFSLPTAAFLGSDGV